MSHAAPPRADRRQPIPRTPRMQPAPLSFAQQRLWFLDQLVPGSSAYNISLVIDLDGALDAGALTQALCEIVRRHEALRTTFPAVGGVPQQVVQPPETFTLPLTDLMLRAAETRTAALDALIADEITRPFDLARGPLFRARLVRLAPDRHVLAGCVHHIVYDAWSNGIFFRELSSLYHAFLRGQPSPLPDLPLQFVDFAAWQRERMRGERLQRELDYWTTHLSDTPRMAWPLDFARPAVQSDRGGREYRYLPEDLVAALDAFGRAEGVTLFITLLSAFAVLLQRFCRQDTCLIGTPIANRTRQELEPLIGFFLNTLALRIDVGGDPTFRELLHRVRSVAFAAYAHQELPFDKLVETLRPERSLRQGPLIDAVFVLENSPGGVVGRAEIGDLRLQRRVMDTGTSKFDLGLLIFREEGRRRATLEYRSDLFEPATAATLLQCYHRLLEGILATPDASIGTLPLLSEVEAASLVEAVSGTTTPYPRAQSIGGLFAAQAARTPDATALIAGPRTLTYRALDAQTSRLAHHLRASGVAAGDRVGLLLDRSLEALTAMLAIVKAGAAYVPLDPQQPVERLAALIARAGVRAVVTLSAHASALPAETRALCLDTEADDIAARPERPLASEADADALAYVLFTSGSTGAPKAVGVPHRAIVRLVFGMPALALGPHTRTLQAAPLMFDASTFEIWAPWLHGGCVTLAPHDVYTPAELESLIGRDGINLLWLTSSLFNVIIDERPEALAGVPMVITGGEALSMRHVERALAALPATTLVNGYGPTEATTFSTSYVIPREGTRRASIPIGQPLANTRVYVLDAQLQPVPRGFPGEIWIGGDALAVGYIDDPVLTAERFAADPFAPAGGRMYRSGDLGRVLADGNLEFLGRTDGQIKIRGFRIEPAEVEHALEQHPAVERAAVRAHERPAFGRTLVAHVVPRAGNTPGADELRAFLRTRLPEPMVPAFYDVVAELPLLPSGKTHRAALPPPDFARHPVTVPHDDTPMSALEAAIAGVRRERLQVAELTRHSHFFERGGDSLMAVQMVSAVAAALDVPLAVRAIFEFPTIAGLAKVVEQLRAAPASPTPAAAAALPAGAREVAAPAPPAPHVRPTQVADITTTLAEIWRHVLELPVVDIDDDFFAIGGHSLLAVRLATDVETRFGVTLPLVTFFEHGTIRRQAEFIAARLAAAGEDGAGSALVAIQPKGTRPPLFLVHAIGGEVLSYAALARHLGPDQPLYGLRARPEDGALGCDTVEQMAAHYVRAIKRLVPAGPYRIGGYSGGGLIAYEMAQQLRAAGEEVARLVMIDCTAPGTTRRASAPEVLAHLVRNTAYWLADDDFFRDGVSVARSRIRSRWARERARLVRRRPGTAGPADIRDVLGLWAYRGPAEFLEALNAALKQYLPQPYDGAIAVIRARTRRLGSWHAPAHDLGWSTLARGGVHAQTIAGAHDTIVREPRVAMLADALRKLLDGGRGGPASR